MTNFDSKMAAAVKSIEEFNTKVAEAKRVNLDTFKEELQNNGGVDDEALSLISWEDLENMGLPKLLAKKVAEIFRAKATSGDSAPKPMIYSDARVKSMTMEQLIRAYDPAEPDNLVGTRLKSISKGGAFLVFVNGIVHVESSVTLLDELRREFPPRSLYTLNGQPYQVYAVGSRPQDILDENPLYQGVPLRPDGTCDKTHMSWNGISNKVRILARIGCQIGVFKITDLNSARDLMDKFIRDDAESYLKNRYPEISLKYEEMENLGQLPNLKMKRANAAVTVNKVQDPFNTGNRTY